MSSITFSNFIYNKTNEEGKRISCVLTIDGKTYNVQEGVVNEQTPNVVNQQGGDSEQAKKIKDALTSSLVLNSSLQSLPSDVIRSIHY